MADAPKHSSFTQGSPFVAENAENHGVNEDVLSEYLDAQQMDEETMEDVIQRGKTMVDPQEQEDPGSQGDNTQQEEKEETQEEEPKTPKASSHVPQPRGHLPKRPSVPLASEQRERVIKAQKEKEEKRNREAAEAEAQKKALENDLAKKKREAEQTAQRLQSQEEPPEPAQAPEDRSSQVGEEWNDSLDAQSQDQHHADDSGEYQNLSMSMSSTHVRDVRRDMEALGARIDKIEVMGQGAAKGIDTIRKQMHEITLSNNQFQTDLLNRLRSLERTLPHDKARTTKASTVAVAASAEPPVSPTGNIAQEGHSSTGPTMTLAERIRRRKEGQ